MLHIGFFLYLGLFAGHVSPYHHVAALILGYVVKLRPYVGDGLAPS